MISPKSYSTESGIILIDILLALSLGVIFVALVSESSINAKEIYENAKHRDGLLTEYLADRFSSTSKMFGNNMIQTDYALASDTISFIRVSTSSADAPSALSNASPFIGTPLCSVDFSNKKVIGSYEYLNYPMSDMGEPTITPILLPINPSLPLTDIEVRNGIAYVSTDSATAADPDLIIFDIRNTANPTILSSINTGPGISSIAIAGQRIFAAAASTAAQLHVIKINSLSLLFLEKKFQLPLPYATATPPMASTIFYDNGRVYLGTEKWYGDEFNILDVSNPAAPVKLGGFEIGSKVNDIYVRDGAAYVTSAGQSQMTLIDVRDSGRPVQINSFSPSGWQRQEGKVVNFFENGIQLGRTSGGYNIVSDYEAFVWPMLASTTLNNPATLDIPGGVYGILSDRYHTFLATRQVDKEFQIFDRNLSAASVATSSSAMSPKFYSLPVAPQAMTCDGNKIYILAHTAPAIYEITF